ncbi:ABC transporter permease [Roseococcus sp. YIM B11640]|uniref:ABC transporter permease n=1 Tax=Roseococcus sp. YIM B11640 TaxID=3133973 RepID=UPI003C7DA27B
MSIAYRTGHALRRTAIQAVPTVLGIIILCFLLLQMMPGDVADVLAGESGSATAESLAAIRRQAGLDEPVLVQLGSYLWKVAQFDFGQSTRFGTPVSQLILERLPNTLVLMLTALGIALGLGILTGAVMAIQAGRWLDRILQVVVLFFYSTPGFWIGLMAIVLFSVHLGWLPSGGSMTIGLEAKGLDMIRDRLPYLVLPALAMASFFIAVYARLTRAALLEVLQQDYIRTARAKGLSSFTILMRHAVRNALIPVTTVAGIHLGNLLGGAVVIETVFSWPGMGRLALEAVAGRDFNVLLGVLLLSSFLVIVTNVAVDLLQSWIDPRSDSA